MTDSGLSFPKLLYFLWSGRGRGDLPGYRRFLVLGQVVGGEGVAQVSGAQLWDLL